MSQQTLENFCNSIIDALYSGLGKGEYFIQSFQGKTQNVYLRIKKNMEKLWEKNWTILFYKFSIV